MKNNIVRLYMDPTGFNQRQGEKNKKLLQEILTEVKSIKKQIDQIKSEIQEKEEKWLEIPKESSSIDRPINGWWFGY